MPSTQPMPALESLRTVEFRQTLRGYHIDDVDEYLERVAVEAEALQEQLRQSTERLRQATDRIVALEAAQRDGAQQPAQATPADDTLQRTLLLAQKFVEQTEAEAQAQAQAVVRDAERHARELLSQAEARARALSEESEKHLREEVTRLEGQRARLAGEVEAITRYLEGERTRLRGVLGEMLRWIDDRVQPAGERPQGVEPPPAPDPSRQREQAVAGPRPGLQTVTQTSAPNGAPR
jgi:cell division initiation protein